MSEPIASPTPEETAPAAVPDGAPSPSPQGRKKKRKVSRELEDLQRWERRASKAAHRLARAVERGMATYRRRRDRSASRKRDGALRDLPVNVAEGMAASLREASRLPVDLARGLDSRAVVRVARSGVRLFLLPFVR